MKKSSLFKIMLIAFLVGTIQLGFGIKYVSAAPDKNVIIVLDTSMSMVGHGGKFFGKDILEPVKKSINKYIDTQIEDGDKITFMTFDTDVRQYPTILIDDENDRDIVKKYISMVEAAGKWTHTLKMINGVVKRAKELETEDDDRQIVIIVMTDGLDDPPPDDKTSIKIEEVAKKQNLWWFYIVDLNTLIKSSTYQEKLKKLEEKIGKVSDNTTIVQVDEKDGSMGLDEVVKDVQMKEERFGSRIPQIIIAVVVVCLLLAIIFLLLQYSKLKVRGKLDFWNNEVLDPYIEHYDLGKKNKREITIGKGVECDLQVRDLRIAQPVTFKAVRHKKELKIAISGGAGYKVEFVNKKPDGFVKAGDIFKVNNYTFKLVQDK